MNSMTVKVRVEAKGFKEFFDNVSRDIAEEVYKRSQENIDKMDIIASGFLKRSGTVMKVGEKSWIVKYFAPYAVFVEYGTEPHRPPIKPLIEWAMMKFGMSEKEAKVIAYKVANKIAKYGTQPRPFLRNAMDSIIDDLRFGRFKVRELELEFKGGTSPKQFRRWRRQYERMKERKLKQVRGE